MCHELRNPLHAIINIAELNKNSGKNDSWNVVEVSSIYMNSIIAEVLDHNQNSSGMQLSQ
jgi:signal transduction histidine kinase